MLTPDDIITTLGKGINGNIKTTEPINYDLDEGIYLAFSDIKITCTKKPFDEYYIRIILLDEKYGNFEVYNNKITEENRYLPIEWNVKRGHWADLIEKVITVTKEEINDELKRIKEELRVEKNRKEKRRVESIEYFEKKLEEEMKNTSKL